MTPMPVIAIVGCPNVGKSSLLNALVGKLISIVEDIPGVTRDRISTPWKLDDHYVELVDTGGYGFVDPDQLTDHIKHQIELAMSSANLVLFIVDCDAGLTHADNEVASLLRRLGLNTILIANKCDGPRLDPMLADFARMGLGTPIGVSAKTGRNLEELKSAIIGHLDLANAPTEIPDPEMHIAIVGKRNAGKSTLVNTIVEIYEGVSDRVIVSEVPGTTRDSIDVRIEKEGKTLVVIDTAGVRKKRHMVTNDLEFYSYHRAQRSIRRADVVLLLIDATQPISEPDKKLAQYVTEQYKPVVQVINKWDLARDMLRQQRRDDKLRDADLMQEFGEYLNAELPLLDFAPIAFTTAKDGKNVQAVMDLAQHLAKQSRLRITTGRLNTAIRAILDERTPSTPSGNRPKIYYATQIDVAPPTIALVVNKPILISDSYQRFMINRLRDLLPYPEVPIRLLLRPRTQRTREGEGVDLQTPSRPARKPKPRVAGPARPQKHSAKPHAKKKPSPKSRRTAR